jgi:chromosome segregation ATPase
MPTDDPEVRIARLEALVEGIQRLSDERIISDRGILNEKFANLGGQIASMAAIHDRLAPLSQVDKMEVRLAALEALTADINTKLVPRPEIKQTIDSLSEKMDSRFTQVGTRIETMSVGVQRLDANLMRLTTILQEDDAQSRVAVEKSNTQRTRAFGYIASFCAIAGLAVSFYLGTHSGKPTVIVQPPAVTTTTTTVPSGR